MNQQNKKPFSVWRLISPLVLYYGIMIVVALFSSMYLAARMITISTATTDVDLMEEVLNYALKMTIPMNTITCVAAIPLFWLMRRRDLMQENRAKTSLTYLLLLCFAAGVAVGLASDFFLTMTSIGSADTGYETVNDAILSAPAWLQVIGVGILAPIAEEYMHRGLLFARLRRRFSWLASALVSAAVFGLIHGNMIQGVYGFMIGLLLAWLMERYDTLLAPILCHVGINMASVILSLINPVLDSRTVLIAGSLVFFVLLCIIVWYIHNNVCPEKKAAPEEEKPRDPDPWS